jgi:molecular chaperone GrpE
MKADPREYLLQKFSDYLEQGEEAVQESTERATRESASTVDLFALFTELAALKNEIRLESRQLKSALDQIHELVSSLETHKRSLEIELEQSNEAKESIRAQTERSLLLELIEVRDRIEAGIHSMDQYRPDLLARASQRNARFLLSMAEGQKITLRRLDDLLMRYQVEPIQAMGATLDPQTMRVREVEHHPDRENGQVISELTRGYRRHADILRIADVIVNKTEASS